MISQGFLQKNVKDIFPSGIAGKLENALRTVERTGAVVPLEYVVAYQTANIGSMPASFRFAFTNYVDCSRYDKMPGNRNQNGADKCSNYPSCARLTWQLLPGLDLNLLLSMLLERVTMLMHIDAAAIFLLNPSTNTLEFASGKGFRSKPLAVHVV